MKPKPVINENSRNVEEILISPEKRTKNVEWTEASIIKTEQHKISKLSNNLTLSGFMIKKLVEVNNLPGNQLSTNKNIRLETPVLRSDVCNYSGVYIVVNREIAVKDTANANKRNKKLTVKSTAPFRSWI